jgi:hypothetical protein
LQTLAYFPAGWWDWHHIPRQHGQRLAVRVRRPAW